ncbi:P-loop NTPase family protein [Paramagnetospirillum magnetotacticum]|uniref:DnaB-like helicase C-terminal domain-containing protein n=1 Tax=Paramagnetospirillum magnetotacticum TaxID=188 RepID=UPI0009E40C96|nr:DnaB-like helicase C-terminal domain-containing protein [Paramagnetospirillum magnetotacticum]
MNTTCELECLSLLSKVSAQKDEFRIRSGFHELDTLTFGFRPGEITLVAGHRPIDKVDFACQVAEYNRLTSFPGVDGRDSGAMPPTILVFSQELPARVLGNRTTNRLGGDKQRLDCTLASTYVIDDPSLSIPMMVEQIYRYCECRPIPLIIIDGADFFYGTPPEACDRRKKPFAIARLLAAAARKTGIHIFITTNLQQEIEFLGTDARQIILAAEPCLGGLTYLGKRFTEAFDNIILLDHFRYVLERMEPAHDPDAGERMTCFKARHSGWLNALEAVGARVDLLLVKQHYGPLGRVLLTYDPLGHYYAPLEEGQANVPSLYDVVEKLMYSE